MIVAFSGTGNSFIVARLLSEGLAESDVRLLQGEALLDPQPEVGADDERIIWVFPTYSWGVPPIMRRYIERCSLKGSTDAVHHLVVTCGDDVGNLAWQWSALLKRKGWRRGGVWSVQMPNTYVCMKGFDVDPEEVETKKIEQCPERVGKIVADISSGNFIVDVVTGRWRFFKTRVIYPWFVRFDMSPKPFKASDKCISCGLCAQECPTLNIKMRPENDLSARPSWDDNCSLCLRCYHNCPAKAIEYGRQTRGKGQYKVFRQVMSEIKAKE